MRILLDECVSRGLTRALADPDVAHVFDLGWSGRRNGVSLASILEADFAVFITVDRNLASQHNIPAEGSEHDRLDSAKNLVQDLLPLVPDVRTILATAAPGHFYRADV